MNSNIWTKAEWAAYAKLLAMYAETRGGVYTINGTCYYCATMSEGSIQSYDMFGWLADQPVGRRSQAAKVVRIFESIEDKRYGPTAERIAFASALADGIREDIKAGAL
jgi:hypothetical protein